jgi:hypothetical protein
MRAVGALDVTQTMSNGRPALHLAAASTSQIRTRLLQAAANVESEILEMKTTLYLTRSPNLRKMTVFSWKTDDARPFAPKISLMVLQHVTSDGPVANMRRELRHVSVLVGRVAAADVSFELCNDAAGHAVARLEDDLRAPSRFWISAAVS